MISYQEFHQYLQTAWETSVVYSGLKLYFFRQYWLLCNVSVIPGNMRGKLNGLGMWLSWHDVASGLPDHSAWDTLIARTAGFV